jgi:O-acetyl-ADP-ribose deacetylase (regulator of RNase III)
MVNWVILGFAIGSFAIGLWLFLSGMRRRAAGERHTFNVFTGFLMGLAATLVIFSFFPTSTANGKIWGFALTGAGAFTVLIWSAWVRFTRTALSRDQHEAELEERLNEVTRREQQLAINESEQRPQVLRQTQRHVYRLNENGKKIGLVTGDLAKIRFADIWVSSENTRMQMSRIDEATISATVRYQGAVIDDLGAVTKDCIADDLRRAVQGRPVEPGRVVITSAGALEHTHGVMKIFHAAAVQGAPGQGFHQIDNVERCVTEALGLAEGVHNGSTPARSIVFPLFGTGTATGHDNLASTSKRLLDAAIEYLSDHPKSNLDTVWFIVFTDAALARCKAALLESGKVTEVESDPSGGNAS